MVYLILYEFNWKCFDFTLFCEKGEILERDTFNPFKLIIYIIIVIGSMISIFIHWCFSLLFSKLEKFKDLNVTRLAQGIPMGGEVHYLDENTLNTAFQSRKKIT